VLGVLLSSPICANANVNFPNYAGGAKVHPTKAQDRLNPNSPSYATGFLLYLCMTLSTKKQSKDMGVDSHCLQSSFLNRQLLQTMTLHRREGHFSPYHFIATSRNQGPNSPPSGDIETTK
jgi:hypothetical protein